MWSDGCYSNPEYDQLYDLQQTSTSPDERQADRQEMQLMLAEEIPEVVLWYDNDLPAYNSDRWTNFSYQPTPTQRRRWLHPVPVRQLLLLQPQAAHRERRRDRSVSSGIPAWVWGADLLAIVVIVRRRDVRDARVRRTDEDKA